MRRPLPTDWLPSTAAPRGAHAALRSSPKQRACPSSPSTPNTARRCRLPARRFVPKNASAAPGASVPVQPMPSAARLNTCTPFWKLAARAAASVLQPAPWTALTLLKSAANGRGRMPAKQNFITRKPGRGASVRQPWRTPVLHADAKQRLTYRQRLRLPQRPPPRKTSWRTFWRRLVHVPANKMICDGSER